MVARRASLSAGEHSERSARIVEHLIHTFSAPEDRRILLADQA
jgi:hypothetical protein